MCLVKSFKEFFLTYELECLYTGDEWYDIQKKRTEYYMVKVDTQKDVEENTVDEDEEEDYDPIFDKVLFCCNDCSFFVSAKEFSGCKKDRIFFFSMMIEFLKWRIMMVGISHNFLSYTSIFWPPPTWLEKSSSGLTSSWYC